MQYHEVFCMVMTLFYSLQVCDSYLSGSQQLLSDYSQTFCHLSPRSTCRYTMSWSVYLMSRSTPGELVNVSSVITRGEKFPKHALLRTPIFTLLPGTDLQSSFSHVHRIILYNSGFSYLVPFLYLLLSPRLFSSKRVSAGKKYLIWI